MFVTEKRDSSVASLCQRFIVCDLINLPAQTDSSMFVATLMPVEITLNFLQILPKNNTCFISNEVAFNAELLRIRND